jgi:hypothetical protein
MGQIVGHLRQLIDGEGPARLDPGGTTPGPDGDPTVSGYGGGAGVEVEREGGVLVDAEDEDPLGELILQAGQALLPQIGERVSWVPPSALS